MRPKTFAGRQLTLGTPPKLDRWVKLECPKCGNQSEVLAGYVDAACVGSGPRRHKGVRMVERG